MRHASNYDNKVSTIKEMGGGDNSRERGYETMTADLLRILADGESLTASRVVVARTLTLKATRFSRR